MLQQENLKCPVAICSLVVYTPATIRYYPITMKGSGSREPQSFTTWLLFSTSLLSKLGNAHCFMQWAFPVLGYISYLSAYKLSKINADNKAVGVDFLYIKSYKYMQKERASMRKLDYCM